MQLLFKTSVLHSRIPVFYSIFKTSGNKYLAHTKASGMKEFIFTKESGEWIACEGGYAHHAKMIGSIMEKHYSHHMESLENSNS